MARPTSCRSHYSPSTEGEEAKPGDDRYPSEHLQPALGKQIGRAPSRGDVAGHPDEADQPDDAYGNRVGDIDLEQDPAYRSPGDGNDHEGEELSDRRTSDADGAGWLDAVLPILKRLVCLAASRTRSRRRNREALCLKASCDVAVA